MLPICIKTVAADSSRVRRRAIGDGIAIVPKECVAPRHGAHFAREPVARCLTIEFERKRMFAKHAHEQAEWGDHYKEQQSHHQRIYDPVQKATETEPDSV